jgi:eukaryotic-like serine/threonine-protein kinase
MHDLANRFPSDTGINAVRLPLVRAIAELNRNNAERTIQLLEAVRRYELGAFAVLWPNYARGLAYLKVGRSREAVTEFQRILEDQPITFLISFIHFHNSNSPEPGP